MDIRRCSKEELDAINERARAWKAQLAARESPSEDTPEPSPQAEVVQLDLFPAT
jgi:hypothetical protein